MAEEGEEFSESFIKLVSQGCKEKLDFITEEILTYDGEDTQPRWMDKESGEFIVTLRTMYALT